MNYLIVEIDGMYDVTYGGTVIESFYSYTDAQDYIASLIWERDQAFADIGCEFDEPWMK
jgi:hypothetical protein